MTTCKHCHNDDVRVRYNEVIGVDVSFDDEGYEDGLEQIDETLARRDPYIYCANCGALNYNTGYVLEQAASNGVFRLKEQV